MAIPEELDAFDLQFESSLGGFAGHERCTQALVDRLLDCCSARAGWLALFGLIGLGVLVFGTVCGIQSFEMMIWPRI